MSTASIRDLRNHGGEVVDRVAAGERVIITRAGVPVAELRPLPKRPLTTEELIRRWRNLPPVDYEAMRRELDEIIDPSL